MDRKTKKPRSEFLVSERKEPRVESDPLSYRRMKPTWRIAKMDVNGSWTWTGINADMLWHHIHDRLKSFESMTWGAIEQERQGYPMEVRILCKEAQDRLRQMDPQTTIDTLYEFHVTQKARIWGMREGTILHLLWWDPEHSVYPVAKKNT